MSKSILQHLQNSLCCCIKNIRLYLMSKLFLYYQTLRHVKPTQLYHQVFYRLRNKLMNPTYPQMEKQVFPIVFKADIRYPESYFGNSKFRFLNLKKKFKDIDWNYSEFGKLWTYNLNYFEFLNQEDLTREDGIKLIEEYMSKKAVLKDGLEPYPISLRGINWIKFLSRENINRPEINSFLFRDYLRLKDNLEYHLLANHLLENGFAMLFGAYYFQDKEFYKVAKSILKKELAEQILKDGAHYELSPMYHQIILHRVLDCYNLVTSNPWKENELQALLKIKAEVMLGWLEKISFKNGEIPYINDAAPGIAPTSGELFKYTEALGLETQGSELNESGYRKFNFNDFEILIDVGQIAPSYQPGHSHADSLQFVLNYKNKPVIVDTGISTYEKNERRQTERSTSSHNTVTVNGENSTKVWSGFRAAERAEVKILEEESNKIEASHNGYRHLGITHTRGFENDDESFFFKDLIKQKKDKKTAEGHLHFHPEVALKLERQKLKINDELFISFSGIKDLKLIDYQFAEGYNKLISAQKLVYQFEEKAVIKIQALD